MEFDLPGFAAHLETLVAGMPALELEMLEEIGVRVEVAAKEKIGEYQAEAGPFVAWEKLAVTTLEGWDSPWGQHYPGKIELGYAYPDNPLLRTGDMRDSIRHMVEGCSVYIGSDSDIAYWQEFGTVHMPPRSFLGGAAFQQAPWLVSSMGTRMEAYLAGLETE